VFGILCGQERRVFAVMLKIRKNFLEIFTSVTLSKTKNPTHANFCYTKECGKSQTSPPLLLLIHYGIYGVKKKGQGGRKCQPTAFESRLCFFEGKNIF
jgi:hypothetical protein